MLIPESLLDNYLNILKQKINMKKLTFIITTVIALGSFTTFAQQDKKASEARKDIKEGQKDLKEAKVDSAADFQKFKSEAQAQIIENQNKIAELKVRKSNDNKEIKAKYDKKVLALEEKNNTLKKKIEEEADKTQTSKWSAFKREFNHDMNELGRSIKDIGVDNKK